MLYHALRCMVDNIKVRRLGLDLVFSDFLSRSAVSGVYVVDRLLTSSARTDLTD